MIGTLLLTLSLFSQTLDVPQLTTDPEVVGQGKTIALYLRFSQSLQKVEGFFLERIIPFYPIRRGSFEPEIRDPEPVSGQSSGPSYTYRALIGIPIGTEPGSYSLRITLTRRENFNFQIPDSSFQSSDIQILESSIEVVETPFEREKITIPRPKQNLLTSQALTEEAKIIGNILSKSRESQYWKGSFLQPIQGRISSPFGIYRIYNDGTASRPHRGVDIANLEGTPILAPNSGRVVLSRHLHFHGNTIIIDHGQGVYSLLNHLKRRFAHKGDKVKKGEKVGLVGETGLATGPHLHWGLSISEIRVDALEWTEREW